MNMIERVARAICRSEGEDPDASLEGDGVNFLWEHWAHGARAAIKAMREPTETMERAGGEVWGPSYADDEKVRENVRAEYTAMIDAALDNPNELA